MVSTPLSEERQQKIQRRRNDTQWTQYKATQSLHSKLEYPYIANKKCQYKYQKYQSTYGNNSSAHTAVND